MDLRGMLWFLRDGMSERQARLFGCACCRRIWPWLVDPRSREVVEIIEQGADTPRRERGQTQALALAHAAREAVFRRAYAEGHDVFHPTVEAGWAAYLLAFHDDPGQIAWQTAVKCAVAAAAAATGDEQAEVLKAQEQAWQADLLREIIGNPFRPIRSDPSWVTPAVADLARTIYERSAFDRLPALADALTEAGCDRDDLLRHWRGDRPHARGCWALDLILF